MAVALGGDCLADVAVVRAQPELFDPVASDRTVSRLFASLAADIEAAMLRQGSASPWDKHDHIQALDAALEQLPEAERGQVVCAPISAGCSKLFLHHITDLGLEYSIGFSAHETVKTAIEAMPAQASRAALGPGWTAAALKVRHRQRARCEDRIRTAKDSGMRNLPFHGYAHNQLWLEIVALAPDLLAWMQTATATHPRRGRTPHLHRTPTTTPPASRRPWNQHIQAAFTVLQPT